MTSFFGLAAAVHLFLAGIASGQPSTPAPASLAITHVTVVATVTGQALEDQTVLLRDED